MRGSSQGLGYPTGYSDEFGKAINFDGTVNARLSQFSYPEGNVDVYAYDPRGNYTDLKRYMKGNVGIPTSSAHVDYDVACSSTVKCNQPNYYIDLNGNRTDYTYDLSTGLKLTETLPAVNVCTISGCNFVRPVNRFAYVQRSAWYLNSSGGYTRDTSPIWLLNTEKTCQTSATVSGACTTAGDETVKIYDYGPDSGPNNLWLRGVAKTAAGITRRSCYSYDRLGKKVSETFPAASLTACP